MHEGELRRVLQEELARPVPPAVAALAAGLAARAGGAAAAVLYYGSNLRDARLDGVLDFYVLLDRVGAWPQSPLLALANRLLPPNVGYFEGEVDGRTLRAKVALIGTEAFRRGMAGRALDTTLWARFSQPCRCAWARSPADGEAAVEAVRQAVVTAARWAAALGPRSGSASAYWRALYARTYEAELRVEQAARGADLVARDAGRYARLLPLAWQAAGVDFERQAERDELEPRITPAEREAAARRWSLRRRLGKPLNLLRLLKAAFTFDGALDYVLWKVERHAGVRPELTAWQRRHPLLAAPGLYLRLRRMKVLR